MGESMNYDGYAERYRRNRFAVDWIVAPLRELCRLLAPGDVVLEVGSGTGNYAWALWEQFDELRFHGFDRSTRMLEQAASRASDAARSDRATIEWRRGDADERFPYPNEFAGLVFSVDVVHHLERQHVLFAESARVLEPGAQLAIVTDAPGDLLARSLTRYFPETLEIEQRRYPAPETLDALAEDAGLTPLSRVRTHGELPITADFIRKIDDRCSSALRLLADEAHAAGMRRLKEAAARQERWQSHYTVFLYRKPSAGAP